MTEEKKLMETIHDDFAKLSKLTHKAINEASEWEQEEQTKLKQDIQLLMDKIGTALTAVKGMDQKAIDAIKTEYKKLSEVLHNVIENASEWEHDKKQIISTEINDGFSAIGKSFASTKEKIQKDAEFVGEKIHNEKENIHDSFVNVIQAVNQKIAAHFNK